MANDIDIRLGLKGRIAERYRRVSTAIQTRNRQIQASMNKAITAAKSFAFSLKGLVVAAGGLIVFQKISRLLSDSVRLFDVQIKAERQLEVALGRTSKELLDQAAALQKVTLYGDEATIQAQALIAAFVKEESQIKTVIPLVQDLATAKGMQLSVAADLVSKTLGSSTNALSRYGIQVEGAVGSTDRLESLTKGLESAFAGSARAAALAGAGPLVQLQNRIGDIKELLGKAFLPLIIEASEILEDFFTGGAKSSDELEKHFEGIAQSASIFVDVLRGGIRFIRSIELSALGVARGITTAQLAVTSLFDKGGREAQVYEERLNDLNKRIEEIQINLAAPEAKSALRESIKLLDELRAKQEKRGGGAPTLPGGPTETGAKERPGLFEQATEEVNKWLDGEAQARERQEELVNKYIENVQRENMAFIDAYQKRKQLREEENAAMQAQAALRQSAIMSLISNLSMAAGASDKFRTLQKGIAIAETTYSTFLSAQKMFEAGTKFPFPASTIMPWVLSGAATAAGVARVAQIKSAATGADFIATSPQYIKVGDNPTRRERVQVTPIGSPNRNGPQGGGMTISGPVYINVSSPDPLLAGRTVQEKLLSLSDANNKLAAYNL